MLWNRFDICAAFYLYAVAYHRGQSSPEYRIFSRLSRIGYKPGLSVSQGHFENDNQRTLYRSLVLSGNVRG